MCASVQQRPASRRHEGTHHEGTREHEDHEAFLYKMIVRALRGHSCLRDESLMPTCYTACFRSRGLASDGSEERLRQAFPDVLHFFSNAGQLTTSVMGAAAGSSTSVLTRNRWPSGETA